MEDTPPPPRPGPCACDLGAPWTKLGFAFLSWGLGGPMRAHTHPLWYRRPCPRDGRGGGKGVAPQQDPAWLTGLQRPLLSTQPRAPGTGAPAAGGPCGALVPGARVPVAQGALPGLGTVGSRDAVPQTPPACMPSHLSPQRLRQKQTFLIGPHYAEVTDFVFCSKYLIIFPYLHI